MNNAQKKALAKDMFMEMHMTGKEIAEKLSISEHTISRWRNKENWDEERKLLGTGRREVIHDLLHQIIQIKNDAIEQKRHLNSKEADVVIKLSTAIDKLDKKLNVPTTVMVFKEFLKWLKAENLELAKEMTSYQTMFIKHVASEY